VTSEAGQRGDQSAAGKDEGISRVMSFRKVVD
jgi:hypothetical protein